MLKTKSGSSAAETKSRKKIKREKRKMVRGGEGRGEKEEAAAAAAAAGKKSQRMCVWRWKKSIRNQPHCMLRPPLPFPLPHTSTTHRTHRTHSTHTNNPRAMPAAVGNLKNAFTRRHESGARAKKKLPAKQDETTKRQNKKYKNL